MKVERFPYCFHIPWSLLVPSPFLTILLSTGTSFKRSYLNLIKSSQNIKSPSSMNPGTSQKIPPSKSITKMSFQDLKKTVTLKSNTNLGMNRKTSDGTNYKSSALKIAKTAGTSTMDVRKRRSDAQEKIDPDTRRKPYGAKRLSNSLTDSEDSLKEIEQRIKTAYDSGRPRQETVSDTLSRWDSLLTILILVMVIVLLMTAPFAFFLGRWRDR